MINQRKIPTFLVLIVILASCGLPRNQAAPNDMEIPARAFVTPSPIVAPTATPQGMLTPTRPRLTSTPSPTPTIEPDDTQTPEQDIPIIPLCAGEGQIVPLLPGFGITGTIVYQTDRDQGVSRADRNHGLYTIGGAPLSQGEIVGEQQQLTVYGFSLDGEWLAYAPWYDTDDSEEIVFNTPVMILLSAGGERIEQKIDLSGLEEELRARCVSCQGRQFSDSTGEWINNDLMHIVLFAEVNDDKYDTVASRLPKVFDPLTGNWQDQWFDNLPKVYTIFPERVSLHRIKLSPDLSRVLYDADTPGIILRDVNRGVEIWSDREFFNPYGEEIAWSPDSKMVAVVNLFDPAKHRLLLITRDGEAREIANTQSLQPGFFAFAASLSWSPDSRYLAFAATLVVSNDDGTFSNDHEVDLYLYDTRTKSYLYHCPLPGVIGSYPGLVWSPDGQWIAFREDPFGAMRLLNVQSGEVVEILENAEPVGWSDKFPVEWP